LFRVYNDPSQAECGKLCVEGDNATGELIIMESLLRYKCFSLNKPQEDSMNQLIQKYRKKVIGVLSGFDRLVLRGTLRAISYTAGMMNFLYDMDVLLKDFN
jgi:hypothetical protein